MMMWNKHSGAPGTSDCAGMALRDIWDVRADPAYDVYCKTSEPRVVAIRTLAGKGRLQFCQAQAIDLHANTLVFVEWQQLRRYYCLGQRWNFWWFSFQSAGSILFPMGQVMQISPRRRDNKDFKTAFAALRRPAHAQRSYASSLVNMMFHRWLLSWQEERPESPHQDTILAIIDQMHERLGEGWLVEDMARSAGMSIRAFRNAFHDVTGQSPKTYYDTLRLNAAGQLLRLGIYTVGEVANQLGYSSAFHLSRMFRRHFGLPPSRVFQQ